LICIKNESKDPHFNLALEEYVLKEMDPTEDYLILWQNSPSVIIGRNQNTLEEISKEYVDEHKINVVRRLSGGGAVYHDLGNLNFTFITTSKDEIRNNFRRFQEPVVKALARFGVKAEQSGRNDITIDGKKFSGNAQYYDQDRVLHHGTILFASDLGKVQEVLTVREDKIASKGIKSVRSRVTNVVDYLPEPISVQEFKAALEGILLEDGKDNQAYEMTLEDLEKIKALMEKRYLTWEWNYGRSPGYDFKKGGRFEGGFVEVLLKVDKGQIADVKIQGDFFGKKEISELELLLKNSKHEATSIKAILEKINLADYLAGVTADELLSCFF